MNSSASSTIKKKRRQQIDINTLGQQLIQGNITALSRGITLVESENSNHQQQAEQLIEYCLPHANKSVRIGITGVPGVGKSTFIEAFGNHLTSLNKKVAVLAVDPSSSISKGSILGDKTRMEDLVKNKNAFIRPSPSGDSLGGVAKKTRESIILCEAAGFDTILIETVGVGQSETAVHSMVDFFLLLKLAGAGDELQGIKRGIIEMADAIIINKADKDNVKRAKMAKTEFQRALHLYPPKASEWIAKTATCSAIENKGIDTVWEMISDYVSQTKANNYFEANRKEQNKYWLIQTIEHHLKSNFYQRKNIQNLLDELLQKVKEGLVSPFSAAAKLLDEYKKLK
ncbi:methylmalonyl Co-A mutase-associated GTPase MeaB [Spongiivirga citrea]|uniref:Methylmalonyl Co-A mutase-associated GTPase MeaB n=2 Tax=Spongiivirga citrea TaxID=1481457 RepID=A0A6M0CE01_9FLAO|nr:methylmalonyl Co-A mutase-associated GTPase MeaB [Spongiivirga citrea]NER16035.1 methylmalonyl Co-A mutase-associated GTPase MeaB [Spongiivirga citrea]